MVSHAVISHCTEQAATLVVIAGQTSQFSWFLQLPSSGIDYTKPG